MIAELDSGAICEGAPHRVSALSADALAILARGVSVVAELAAVWNRHATVVGDVDAALADALAASDSVAREAERAVAEQLARRDAAQARRETLRGRARRGRTPAGDCAARSGVRPRGAAPLARWRTRDVSRGSRSSSMRSIAPSIARARSSPNVAGSSRITGGRAADSRHACARRRERRLAELAAAVAGADHHAAALAATLAADADARARRAAALAELAAAEHGAEVDRVLGQVIGSHDGKLFRSFAQSLTLDGLLAVANSHLEELAPRYQLERVPKHDLELQVIDRDLGNEVRSVQSLSGGESFLVSLALALGLSSMSAHDVRVRTLLIDEGFGTLDPATLDSALAVLDALQATGRQVGVISHVPALVERVGRTSACRRRAAAAAKSSSPRRDAPATAHCRARSPHAMMRLSSEAE